MMADYSKSPFLPYFKNSGLLTTRKKSEQNNFLSPFDIAEYYSGKIQSTVDCLSEDYNPFEDKIYTDFMQGIEFSSIEEIEDYIMNKITNTINFIYHKSSIYPDFHIIINRWCNLISAKTRYGAGNVAFVSKYGLEILQQTNAFTETENKETIGRWRLVGLLNNCIKIYLGEHLPEDTVYVVGAFDKPGHANVIEHDSKLYLVTLPEHEMNYYTKIQIVNGY